MTYQNPCEYLVIHYAPAPEQADSFAWALLARSISDPGRRLELVTASGWQGRVRPQHREYLLTLLEDWSELRGPAAESLFQLADELSAGPIRIGTRRRSTFAELAHEAQSLLEG